MIWLIPAYIVTMCIVGLCCMNSGYGPDPDPGPYR